MKTVIFICLLIFCISCAEKSNSVTISIPAYTSHVFEHKQKASFQSTIQNMSNHEIRFTIVDTETKQITSSFNLLETGEVDLFIKKNETVVFDNNNEQRVRVQIQLQTEEHR